VVNLFGYGLQVNLKIRQSLEYIYHMKDLVTHEIFEDLLKDEVSDEEDWENFLPSIKQKSSR